MRTAEELYGEFVRRYPDVFDRREAISRWCQKAQDYEKVAREIWKLLDISEEEGE